MKSLSQMRLQVQPDDLVAEVGRLLHDGWRLALVAGDHRDGRAEVAYTFLRPVNERAEVLVQLDSGDLSIPTLSGHSYPAGRFERELHDLFGIEPIGHPAPRRLVLHGHWPHGWHPMRSDAGDPPPFEDDIGSYPFLEVEGSGVYEIPVGPVHAGLIEPGHFRFSVVGETILRMKARLWFLHRGVERLFQGRSPEDGLQLAERISGDTAVGHSLAFAMAIEDAAGIQVPAADLAIRASLLELERLYNHVNDVGAIVNDVGFGIAHTHTQRLREELLRHNEHVTGHRLLRGAITIGGASLRNRIDSARIADVAARLEEIARLALDHGVVADRLTATAVLSGDQAAAIGAVGFVARASGLRDDARRDHPFHDIHRSLVPVSESDGDVRARFTVRVREASASAGILTALASGDLGSGNAPVLRDERALSEGLGVTEGWRGVICHRVAIEADGALQRVKVVDPSFFNWPALPLALADTIVPDFPLANKSFNQSYAGNDL